MEHFQFDWKGSLAPRRETGASHWPWGTADRACALPSLEGMWCRLPVRCGDSFIRRLESELDSCPTGRGSDSWDVM